MTAAHRSLPARLALLLALLTAVACTIPNPLFVAPDGDGGGDSHGDSDTDTDADSNTDADLDAPDPGIVRRIGDASCQETESVVPVPEGVTVAAGHRIVLRVSLRGTADGLIRATDSAENHYELDHEIFDRDGDGLRVALLSARVVRALGPGDAITVSHPAPDSSNVVAEEFQGITDRLGRNRSKGTDAAPRVTLSLDAGPALVYAATATMAQPPYTPDGDWEMLGSSPIACTGMSDAQDVHGSVLVVTDVPAEVSHDATLAWESRWVAVVVAYGVE